MLIFSPRELGRGWRQLEIGKDVLHWSDQYYNTREERWKPTTIYKWGEHPVIGSDYAPMSYKRATKWWTKIQAVSQKIFAKRT